MGVLTWSIVKTPALTSEIRFHFGLSIDGKERRGCLADDTSLFEAEITGPAGGRGTDDNVILLDLQEPRAFGEPASQASVGFAWRWIATGMVVLCGPNRYVIRCACPVRRVSSRLV
jgi:hypothetical protein